MGIIQKQEIKCFMNWSRGALQVASCWFERNNEKIVYWIVIDNKKWVFYDNFKKKEKILC